MGNEQLGAVDLLRAFNAAIHSAVSVNVKHMTVALCMLFQIAPSGLWGEALHVSGLFTTIVKGLEEDKVRRACPLALVITHVMC